MIQPTPGCQWAAPETRAHCRDRRSGPLCGPDAGVPGTADIPGTAGIPGTADILSASGTAGVSPALQPALQKDESVSPSHKHWHSRGYLPHCDTPGLLQVLTFRLADSLPRDVLQGLLAENQDEAEQRKRIEALLDAGHGACRLRDAACARIVENALLHFDGVRYRLIEWCVMPNHVHVLIETKEDWPLGDIVQSWKSFSAKEINKRLGRTGTVWRADYHDRFIRDDKHLAAVRAYIRANPVAAGLVETPEDWLFSSAAAKWN